MISSLSTNLPTTKFAHAFEFFVGVEESNVVHYEEQHNYNTNWKLRGPKLTA